MEKVKNLAHKMTPGHKHETEEHRTTEGYGTQGTATTTAGAGTTQCVPGGEQKFSVVEDRPVVKERVEQVMEHRPVEHQYVTETRPVGDVEHAGNVEHLGTTERVVDEERREGGAYEGKTRGTY